MTEPNLVGDPADIAILKKSGKVISITVHWDGCQEKVGQTLLLHYTNQSKVEKLVSLGDLSELKDEVSAPSGQQHDFNHPFPHVTIAYFRDHKEAWKDCKPLSYPSEEEFWHHSLVGNSYAYLFKDGCWWFQDRRFPFASGPIPLMQSMAVCL